MTVAATGVVLGSIGTTPLYALDQMFYGPARLAPTPDNVLGCLSLAIWAITLIVSIKYAALILRADSDGEGGIFALYSLLHRHRSEARWYPVLLGSLMLGAGLLFGDAIISPAISVLAAVEGLSLAAPGLDDAVVPITLVILALLFAVQHRGTAGIATVFGPVLVTWFAAIAILGARQIAEYPEVLHALNPLHGVRFLGSVGFAKASLTIGALILVVTGSEAMYADLGHFGRRPIRLGWFAIVCPALLLNYLGQGAVMLHRPPVEGGELFYALVPSPLLYPMVLLATLATVVASQALISGTYSLASQAIALGLFPRLRVVHTHDAHEGQIYLPFVNWALFAGCAALVYVFRNSSSLAAAYGLAVAGVMVITSFAMIPVGVHKLGWTTARSGLVFGLFTALNLVFLLACSLKFFEGGYIPLSIGLAIFAIMRTWRWGRKATFAAYTSVPTISMRSLVAFHASETAFLQRIALLMTPKHIATLDDNVPSLLQILRDRYGILPRHLIFVEVAHLKVPYIHDDRYDITVFDKAPDRSIIAVTLKFGFMEEPNVEAELENLARHHLIALPVNEHRWIVHVSVENLLPASGLSRLGHIRLRIFSLLRQISQPAHYFYGLGDNVQLSAEIMPVRLK